MKVLIKIDKFVYIFVGTLILLSVLMVVVFRGIFSSILVAYGPPVQTSTQNMRVNKGDLTKSLEYVRNNKAVRLDAIN